MLEYPERFFRLDYRTGVKCMLNKLEFERDEVLHKEWLSDKPNLKDEYKGDFQAYKAIRTRKKLKQEDKEKAKKRIDETTERIRLRVVK